MKLKGFKEFVNESYSGDSINIFDLDDCLVITSAKIRVFDPTSHKEYALTPAEYNSYVHDPSHRIDFSDFDNKDILLNGRIIQWVVDILIKTMKKSKAVGIITARGEKSVVLEFLKKHDLRINPAFVFAVGERPGQKSEGSIAERKQVAFKELINMGFKKFKFFDDNISNLEYAKALEKTEDGVKVDTVHILPKWIPRFD